MVAYLDGTVRIASILENSLQLLNVLCCLSKCLHFAHLLILSNQRNAITKVVESLIHLQTTIHYYQRKMKY